jgi:hypothetical protein
VKIASINIKEIQHITKKLKFWDEILREEKEDSN